MAKSITPTMDKRIVVITPGGSEHDLVYFPSPKEIRSFVGGLPSLARVLREDLPDFVYTYMYVNDNGLNEELPRNQKATDIYLANTRRARPGKTFKEIADENKAIWEAMGATYINLNPEGYDEDPYIAGTVVWFAGWTIDEIEQYYLEQDGVQL